MRLKLCVSITISKRNVKQSTLRMFMKCFFKFLNCFHWLVLLEENTFVLQEEYHLTLPLLKNLHILSE